MPGTCGRHGPGESGRAVRSVLSEPRRERREQTFEKARPAEREPEARGRKVAEAREGQREHLAVGLRAAVAVTLGADLRELAAATDAGLLVAHDVPAVEKGDGSGESAEPRRDDAGGHRREVRPEREGIPLPVEEPVKALVSLGGHAGIGGREIEDGKDHLAETGVLKPAHDGILRFTAALGRVEEKSLHAARQIRVGPLDLHGRNSSTEENRERRRGARRKSSSRGLVSRPVKSVAWPAA